MVSANVYNWAKGVWNDKIDMSSKGMQLLGSVLGYTQYWNTKQSNQAQISYDEYLGKANRQALEMWQKNVPGRQIAVPGLSYPGAIYRADTGVARSMYNTDSAMANLYGNAPYRTAGLYGIGSRVSRWI